MSKRVKVKLNSDGIRQLLKSQEMRTVLEGYGDRVVSNAGAGYSYSTHTTEQRAIVNVYPTTKETAIENAEDNTLLRSLT